MPTTLRHLPANPLLLHCTHPLDSSGSETAEGLFRYAADAVKALLKEELAVYEKLKLSVYDSVISGTRTVSRLTRKKYPHAAEPLCAKLMSCVLLDLLTRGKPLFIYGITDNGAVQLRQITAELSGNTEGLEKQAVMLQKSAVHRSPSAFGLKRRTEELNLKVSVSLMRSAADDLRFISRYNEETFFRGLPPGSFASPFLDLSEKSVRNGFAALYAMTFFGLTESDLFTVSGVFGFTDAGVRSKDDLRLRAAKELAGMIGRGDLHSMAEMADKMGARLLMLPLPEINADDPASLAQGCTLYAGCARLGKAYIAALAPLEIAIVPDDIGSSHKAAKQRALLLSRYDSVLALCQEILTLTTTKKCQICSLKGYGQSVALAQEAAQLTVDSKQ